MRTDCKGRDDLGGEFGLRSELGLHEVFRDLEQSCLLGAVLHRLQNR